MQESNSISQTTCIDAPDCAESIVDPVACDFTPWASDRCPVTCQVCTESRFGEDDQVIKMIVNFKGYLIPNKFYAIFINISLFFNLLLLDWL